MIHLYMVHSQIHTDRKNDGTRNLGKEGMETYCLTNVEFQFRNKKNFGDGRCNGCTAMWIYLMH